VPRFFIVKKIENQIINQIKKYLMTATQLKSDIESLWKHVKKGNVKFKLYSLVIVLAMLLLPLCLTAQITFAEKPPVDNTPEWWHLKDEMLMPYDSTYLKIQAYPTLEAYKKYIGQRTIFYPYLHS
jgi:hypothetical protein